MGLFEVCVETYFWAAHRLTLSDGSKEPLHRHHWKVTAEVAGSELNQIGLVLDFRRLKSLLDGIVAGFDNAQLEKLDCFRQNNPTAENVAKYVYERLTAKLPKELKLSRITVFEQPGCAAGFTGEGP